MKVSEMVYHATIAANIAGDRWIANAAPKYEVYGVDFNGLRIPGSNAGTMLDLCGNAHVQFKDKRTADYKQFVAAGAARNAVVEIQHKYKHRQEIGLAIACAEAAKKTLEGFGVVGLRIWSYID